MADEMSSGGLHIDSDWKTEAAREKEKLAAQEQRAAVVPGAEGGEPEVGAFLELVNLMAMQAAIALGGLQGPGGERIPPNPASAKHFIEMLEILQAKTKGNLTQDEQRVLDSVLYELRIGYVQVFAPPVAPGTDKGKTH